MAIHAILTNHVSIVARQDSHHVDALITLKECRCMMTNIVGCEFSDLEIGLPVTVIFEEPSDGSTLPKFTP